MKIEDKEIISELRIFVKNNWEIFEQEKIEEEKNKNAKKAVPEIEVKENPIAEIEIEPRNVRGTTPGNVWWSNSAILPMPR